MDIVADYWLPVLAAAVAVFVVSSVLHMLLPIHRNDFGKLPDEDAVRAALRQSGAKPGSYGIPGCHSMKEMGSEEVLAKYREGPVGFLTLLPPGPPAIGKSLLGWFAYTLLVGFVIAYLGHFALAGQPDQVFRFATVAGILAYGLSAFPESIWKGQKLSVTLKFVFDGILYGLATGLVFDWLWPSP